MHLLGLKEYSLLKGGFKMRFDSWHGHLNVEGARCGHMIGDEMESYFADAPKL